MLVRIYPKMLKLGFNIWVAKGIRAFNESLQIHRLRKRHSIG